MFVNLLWLLFRQGSVRRRLWLLPPWVLALSSLVGLAVGIIAIIDTVQNSYDPPDVSNSTWLVIVSILAGIFLVIGALGGMVLRGEAEWQGMNELK